MAATVKVHQSDIDRFIQEQKSKLATERQHFDDGDNRYTENEENLPKDKRKTWDKTAVINHPLAEEAPKRPKTTELSSLPLRNSVQENRKLLLAAQRNKEYNELIAKKKASQKQRTKPAVSAENISVEDYEKTQRILRYKKQQEYKRILDEQKAERDRLLLQQHSAEILQKTVAPPKQRPEDSHVVQPELRPDQNYQGRYDEKHSKQPTYDKSGRRPSIEELLDRLKHSQQETVAYMMDEHPVNYTQYSDTDGRFKRYTQEPADQTRQPLPDRERWKDYRHDETLPQANQYQSTSPRPLWQQDPEHDLKALNNIGHRDGDLRRRVDREAESEKAAYQEVWRQMHAGEAGIQPQNRSRRLWRESSKETGLPIGIHEKQKSPDMLRRKWREPSVERGLPLSEHSDSKNKFEEEKHREYEQFKNAKSQDKAHRMWREPSTEKGLPLGAHNDQNKKHKEETQEYHRYLSEKNMQQKGNRTWREPSQEQLLPVGQYENERKRLEKVRNEEYSEITKEKPAPRGRENLPPKPPTPGGFLNKLGGNDKQRQRLNEERRQEYNKLIAEKSGRSGRNRQTDDYMATIPGLGGKERQHDKAKQRNDEYNQYMREKDAKPRPQSDKHGYPWNPIFKPARKPDPPVILRRSDRNHYASLPGLNYDRSQAKVLPNEVTDGPRRGWATPTYEEILNEKRAEEARYRRYDDPEYIRPGMRQYGSEGALHNLENVKRLEKLDREFESKKQKFHDDRSQTNVLEDPNWLTPRYHAHESDYRVLLSRLQDYSPSPRDELDQPAVTGRTSHTSDAPKDPQLRREAPRRSEPRAQNLPRSKDSDCYATLPIGQIGSTGHDKRHSAVQRQKEQYRQELEKQMKEMEELKKREKNEDLRINATGANDPAKRNNQLREVAQPPPQAPVVQVPVVVGQQYPAAEVAYMSRLANYDQISPRSELVLGRRRLNNDADLEKLRELDLPRLKYDMKRDWGTRVEADGGILERGFDTLLEPPKAISIQPPPELKYEPSPYLTGGTGYSSLDEQYHYLGTMNPLSADIAAPEVRAPQIALAQAGVVPMASGAVQSKIRFDDRGGGGGHYGGGGGGGYGGGGVGPLPLHSDEKDDKKVKQQQYQAELKRQMEEARQKKQSAKMEKEMYDRKFEEEYKNYNPFGKGGGGAPMRDQRGNVIADLRTVLKDGSGQSTGNLAGYESPRKWNPYTSPRPPSPRDDKIKTPPKQTTALGDVTHARGGHGIFGQPKTEAEKTEADRYKDELQRQIEEKKMQKMLEKEKERMEEQIEERRIEEERRRMQMEVEEERRRIREKEEIARRQQEEHARQAEERRREIERKKKEEDEHHQEHLRQMEKERMERDAAQRQVTSPPIPAMRSKGGDNSSGSSQPKPPASPPVPAVKTKAATSDPPNPPQSPPVPAVKTQAAAKEPARRNKLDRTSPHSRPQSNTHSYRAQSADVLNHLAQLKSQLQAERNRVETMLDQNEREIEVFDPRLAQRPPQVPGRQNMDVFEMARNRDAVSVKRTGTATEYASPSALHDFEKLKQNNTDSRHEFLRQYPHGPITSEALEAQQAALLREQERSLRMLKDRSTYDHAMPSMKARPGTDSAQSMLKSNSAFIDMDGLGPVFPEDLEDLPQRNDSARARRRRAVQQSPSLRHYDAFGSVSSLDVDQIAKRNEKRLKNLRDLQGDDVSMNDPDDLIDHFLKKQTHNRPPTSQTMQDDSWLQVENRGSRY
ncbi:centrosome and spindle pole-associated protein 1-like isoform X7 [Gigantopelta aegis]|uniref:centrosome and spindle pole-associated protein 1-like isoform X7 n=1 Tax=Gigantopelta aegis TaxID=1735272 RepID=UPI001B88D63D|nr:centrosome and spindle pole-associated protein 1-like isoform X7 [Gigantopelta aegis]